MSDRPMRDEDLVRVRSLSELRPGMTVVTKNCGSCGGDRAHTEVLVSSVPRSGVDHSEGNPCRATVAWITAPGFAHPGGTGRWCFCGALAEGRLYRLRSSDGKEREEGAGLDRKAQLYQSALKLRREGAL